MSSKKKVVLVVDDTSENIDVLRGILSSEYTVKAAVSGERALKVASSENRPDLILLDIMMPEMDGYEVCRQLKANKRTKDIPVIFVTAKSEVDDETLGLEVGAVDYITKPVSPPIVSARVRNIIRLQQSQNDLQEVLDKTLTGSIELMMDVLSLINPVAFGRARNLRRHVCATAKKLGYQKSWSFELAAVLSQLGCITIPEELLEKIYSGEAVSEVEQELFNNHPLVAKRLLEKIPKFEETANIIALQNSDVASLKDGVNPNSRVYRGVSLLQVAFHLDDLDRQKRESDETHSPKVCATLITDAKPNSMGNREREVSLSGLLVGMIFNSDITTKHGMMLIKKGTEVTKTIIERLQGFKNANVLQIKTFKVIFPNCIK